jgi:hypothetical protein
VYHPGHSPEGRPVDVEEATALSTSAVARVQGAPMKHPMSLEATLDQLVSDFVRALLEAALKTTPSDFAALGPDSGVRSSALSPPVQEPPRVRPRRASPPSAVLARPNSAPSREAQDRSSPSSPPHGEEASPAHAITDPALLLRAIDDATASPEPETPPMPSRATRAVPALLETTVAEASTGSTLRAGEEILRKTGAGMVFRRTSPRRS